jgi:hypothetical protein
MRVGVEKIKKQTGARKLTKNEKDSFKAELYIFLQRKTKECLDRAITKGQRANLHSDIVSQFENIQLA